MNTAKAVAFITIILGFIISASVWKQGSGPIKRIEILPNFVYTVGDAATDTSRQRQSLQKNILPPNSDYYPPPRETRIAP